MPEEEAVGERLGIIGYVVLVGAVILAFFPIFWMISTSLKPYGQWLVNPPIWIPTEPTLRNYVLLFKTPGVEEKGFIVGEATFVPASKSILDSAIVAGIGTLLSIIIGLLAAIGISRYRIGGTGLPFLILMLRMVPPIVSVIPMIVLYSNLNLIDTYQGLILAYAIFTAPYSTWMIKSFIDEVPRELEEVGLVEGLTPLETHFKITLPMIKGGIAATALFVMILNWSEFLFALVLTHGSVVTIPVQETRYFTYTGVQYGPQAALGIVAVIPLFVFGFLIQKYLARGLTFGAIRR